MSEIEKQIDSVHQFAKSIRGAADEEAEARWKADEARRAANIEAHTAYLLKAAAEVDIARERSERMATHTMEANASLIETNKRQATALERMATALERLAVDPAPATLPPTSTFQF